MNLVEEAYDKSIEVLKKCSTSHGFYASGGVDGYTAIWSRDSMISSLGASLIGEKFKEVFKQSLITLGNHQSKNGQIPNCVDKWSGREPHVDFKTIDSSLWFIIGHYVYKKRYQDSSLFEKQKSNVEKALSWLRCQDSGEIGMLTQLPTSDWQDAFPHRYGYTINTEALWYYVLTLVREYITANKIKKIINEDKDDCLWNGEFYVSYRWKNHGQYKEIGNWFDTLGNLLAIIFNLADKNKSGQILNYIKKNKLAEQYPIRDIYPPIKKGDKDWQDYYLDCDARAPYSYLNGGIWTFIGGFYVLALIKQEKFREAEYQLEKLAAANMKLNGNFSEWLHGKTGKPSKGGNQAWNAGMYVLAYESVRNKAALI